MMMAATHRAYWWTPVAVLCSFAGAASGTPLNLTVLSWNVHWQCGSDHIPRCRSAATSKIIELAAKHAANVIVAVELEHNDTAPIDLPSHGLPTAYPRWAQVNGTCPGAPGKTGDALALVLGSDWELQQVYRNGKYEALADGGCLGGDTGGVYKADARAFAVALAKPPQPGVKGCEKGVCLIGLHSPHIDITKGADKVAAVCGEARHKCTVAVGDWNAPFSKQPFCDYTVQDRWGQLLGAASQTAKLVAAPDENTCCFPESKYLGWDDHAVTNIAGATVSATALPYQMGGAGGFGKDTEEHKPIVATVQLPTPCDDKVLRSVCDRRGGSRLPADCEVCTGQHQHLLRHAGCRAADIAAWCNGPAGAAAAAVVSVCKVELLWQRITSGGHNSCPGNVVPCASGAASTRMSMARAAALGFTVMRFAASGFWPPDQKLFVDESTRPQFLAALDSVFDDAQALGVRLIPSLQWNHWAFADVCNGTLGGDMMRDPDSCAHHGSRQFISTVVGRYSGAGSKYRDVVYAWELGNELDLQVDLDHANKTSGCAPLLGTPQYRTSADNFSTADMVSYQGVVAGWIRRAAAPHAVLISSGHAIPRPSAKHLALSYHKHQTDWTKDTEEELVEVLQLFHTGLDLISLHIYPGPAACVADPSAPTCDNYRFGQPPPYLVHVAAKAATASGKLLYLGEFGVSLPDRRDPSSPIYNFTEQMLGAAQNAGATLATIWGWEDDHQAQTYGIFPANETDQNDARTIRALQAAATTSLDVTRVASEETSFETALPPGPDPLWISTVYVDGNDVQRAVFVDSPSPTFSWELDCRSKGAPDDAASIACPRGTVQAFHRLQIFSARTKALVVDSGVIDGPVPSLSLRQQGLTFLEASTRYNFELSVWAFRDKSRSSHTRAAHATVRGQFHTALFSPAEWTAEWISGGTMLRSSPFSVRNNTMVSATLFASGIGCFSLTINGLNVDTAYPTSRMDPGFSTAPRARLLYRAYDVLPLLNGSDGSSDSDKTAASFVVGVRLGFCKYGFLYNECDGAHATHAKCRAISLQLTITYANGSKQTVQTNTHADSSRDDVVWTATTTANPTRYTHLYHGEIFDARLEQPGWDTATGADTMHVATAWQPAIAYPNPEKSRLDVLSLHTFPPMGVAAIVAPIKSWMVASDNTSTRLLRRVFDFGNNYAGVTEVSVTGGAPGALLTMRHTEIADDNDGRTGPVDNTFYIENGKNCFDRVLVDGNCANQTEQLILGTSSSQVPYVWSPLFTYHGFRYMQLEMNTHDAATIPGGIESIQVRLYHVHTMVESAGGVEFSASSAEGRTLNKIQRSYLQTQRNNLHAVPTDCPTREKRGWMADAAVTSTSALLNFRLSSFYANWLRTMADTQSIGCSNPAVRGSTPDSPYICCNPRSNVTNDWGCTGENFAGDLHGSLPVVVPESRFTAYDPQNKSLSQQPAWPGDPIWMAAAAIIPLEHYRSTGDVAVAQTAYPAAKALVDFFARHGDPLINFGAENDWLAIEACTPSARRKWALPGPTCLLANISFASAQIAATDAVARLAEATGVGADADKYFTLLGRLKQAFHQEFFDHDTEAYAGGYQTVQILPLYFNVTPPAQQASVVAALVKSLTEPTGPVHDINHDCNGTTPCLASGFWGTRYALQALTQYGHANLSLALATKTAAPSWGAMANSKPGTLWEQWVPPKGGAQSRDHPAFGGGIAAYLYVLAGISEATNHGHLVIALPQRAAAAAIGWAKVSVDTGAGAARTKVALQWSMMDEELKFEVYIPVGFTGKAVIASLPPPLCSNFHGEHENAAVLSDVSDGGTVLSREALLRRDAEGNAIDIPLTISGITRLRFSCS